MCYNFFRKEKTLLIGMFHTIMRSIHYSRNRVGYGFARIISLISYYYFIDFIYTLLASPRRLKACGDIFHRFHTIMKSMKYHLVLWLMPYYRGAASVTGLQVMVSKSGVGYGFISHVFVRGCRLRVLGQWSRKVACNAIS